MDKIPAGSIPPEKEKVEEPKTFAGKFKAPEELESAYLELEKEFGSKRNELGSLRKENEKLTESLNNFSKQSQKTETPKEEKPAAPDVGSALNEIGKMYEDGDMTFAEAMAKASEVTAQSVQYQANERLAQTEQSLLEKFQSTLTERDQQAQIEQFHKNNPDYTEFLASEDYKKIMEEDSMHDDYSAYRVFKEREKAQAAIDEAQRIRNGSEPAKSVASKPGHNVQNKNKTRTSDMGELKQRMREKLENLA